MSPSWLTAFLDLAPGDHADGVAHWQAVTGWRLSPSRGEHGEFASIVPPDGDPYLSVQRLGEGPSGHHLDLHVPDVSAARDRAAGLGARVLRDTDGSDDGYVSLASPGGLSFCLVTPRSAVRPAPAAWADGVVSLVDQLCVDVPPSSWDGEVAFWQELTGWSVSAGGDSEFARLEVPSAIALRVLLQRLDDEAPSVTAHLDLSTTDRAAETERHLRLGARLVDVRDEWTVMAAPVGPPYCITERSPAFLAATTGQLP